MYKSHLDKIDTADIKKDAKTQLQEYLQSRKENVPVYEVISEVGSSHEPEFTVLCKVDLFEDGVLAKGKSKRKAEQAVAKKVIAMLLSNELKK